MLCQNGAKTTRQVAMQLHCIDNVAIKSGFTFYVVVRMRVAYKIRYPFPSIGQFNSGIKPHPSSKWRARHCHADASRSFRRRGAMLIFRCVRSVGRETRQPAAAALATRPTILCPSIDNTTDPTCFATTTPQCTLNRSAGSRRASIVCIGS